MRLHTMALGILVALGGISCAGGGGAGSGHAAMKPVGQAHRQGMAAVAQAKLEAQQASLPSIPEDAQYTIYCTTISGPEHAARAKALKNQLMQATALRDWYIVHGDAQSLLYYGFYREDQEARMHQDCRAISGVMASNGDRMFMGALPMPLETVDPSAPPDWNLLNAKGAYTLQIAMYRDHPQRREYAVQAVREARAAGYEAYYYHGATASFVCIGTWPEEAVVEQDEVRAQNPHEVIGVVPSGLPIQEGLVTADGRPIRVVRPRLEIKDPTLRAMMQKFPTHSINGLEARKVKNPLTGKVRVERDPSVIVKIPQRGSEWGLPLAGDPRPSVGPANADAIKSRQGVPRWVPPTVREPQGGKLRSIGD